jgi:isopentenyldiphosphate isomerase
MTEELIDEIDLEGNVIATHPKSYLKEKMFLHKVSLVIPAAKGGKILICRRAKDKYPYPDTWCCAVGGKVASGETYEKAAMREMQEEVGKTFPIKKVASFVYDKSEYKGIFNIFTTTVNVSSEELEPDPEEIQYTKEFEIKEVLRMLKEKPEEFSPTFICAITEFAKHFEGRH